ncbi:quinone oxidoreductase [Arthrobacter sp. zg-Y820]|uniref:quinone oxidoreductase family protein n=1 Tax=unclassified Arthrobacter TaxID=235627 RepID=UPI001E39F637|nr:MULTISPECIES: quinone oxidoreductase [unclassified Arthrobacter]MCC9198226.1 quinone oxidoreductase [Arthrobacter sp. zg-Y820]MDK1281095.1 quinone oxidoreductase [Arthrobacter sp. zg.Y820]WIB10553.1 quinone oxidoreductase [Arthrobacter sp. zg-Y820]
MHKAIVVPAPGGPEILRFEDVDLPQPGPKELLVRVGAVGVNFIDTYKRSGIYPMAHPFIPGAEAAGTVVASGRDVAAFREGARVATAEGGGTYSEYTIMEADKALPIPDGVSDEIAAALPMQGMTAHYLCNSTFPVEEGQTVLTHAGAGGVGLLLIQLLKAKGATVITTASSDEKRELARSAGADYALGYDGFAEAVRQLTDGRGVDVVYDGVGKATFDGSLGSLRKRGMLVLFGGASGQVPPFDIQRLNSSGSLYLTRPTLDDYLLTAEERQWRAHELFEMVRDGTLDVRIGATYPLAEAAAAQTALEGRKTTGKVLLLP